jgi:electron transfer flavoprotein beta subunit
MKGPPAGCSSEISIMINKTGDHMKILVCVKQVPDTESPVTIDAGNRWILEHDLIAFRMNRYDEYALEEAVQIREAIGDVTVDAISVGPARVSATLRKSLEKGAHNAIHIVSEKNDYYPPVVIADLIADYARHHDYDLIFTGVMAEDDMQCQVGPLIAARLGLPCAASVLKKALNTADGTINAECELEGGITEIVRLPLPCLMTIQSGINRPRYPSLSNVMRAKEQELIRVPADSNILSQPAEKVVFISYPEQSSKGTIIQGTPDQKAEKLLAILHEKSLL